MPSSRRFRTRRLPSQQRKLVWNRHFTETNISTTNAGAIYDLLNPLQTDLGSRLVGATVMRVRGHILYQSGAISGISTNNMVGVGIRQMSSANDPTSFGLISTNASANAQSPVGLTGKHQDWLGYDTAWIPANNWVEHFVDFKAHRKVDEVDQGMGLFVAAPQLLSAGTWTVNCRLSVLVALH